MGLHMLNLYAVGLRKRLKRTQLIFYVGLGLLRSNGHVSAAESHQIRKSRMGSYSCPKLLCQGYRFLHYHRISCMPAAGYVSGGNVF